MRKTKNKLPPISETEFMAQVIDLAKMRGWKVYHTHDSRNSEKGFPDLFFLRGKIVFAAELKSRTGQTTKEQEEWIEGLKAADVPVFLWRPTPEDWREIERALE